VVTAKTQYNLANAKEYFEEHLCVGDYYDEGQRVSGDAWNTLAPAQREAANLHFLDVVAGRGDKILLSVPKSEIIPGTALHTEIQYLQNSLNYRWVNQWSLRPR
jgi:hypothetical protein